MSTAWLLLFHWLALLLYCTLLFFFFFQAEDGIRDLVRSRGLGDVYKRQGKNERTQGKNILEQARAGIRFFDMRVAGHVVSGAVSYTHLTLPTSDLV